MDGNEFEIDDFERTLREYADRFYLKPSERVWKSIYNDLHPGSKWPSFAVALFMIFTLFWIGNNNRTNPGIETAPPGKMIVPPNPVIREQIMVTPSRPDENDLTGISGTSSTGNSSALHDEAIGENILLSKSATKVLAANTPDRNVGFSEEIISENTVGYSAGNKRLATKESGISSSGIPLSLEAGMPVKTHIFDGLQNNDLPPAGESGIEAVVTDIFNKQRKQRLDWKYYFSPMVTGVTFGGVNLNDSKSTVAYTPVSGHQMNIADRLGFVVGANAYYSLRGRLSLYTGLHLGHMGYNIFGRTSRPDIATLTLVDRDGGMYKKAYISRFSNGNEGMKADVTNFNWQLSIPVGVKYDVISGNKLKISMISGVEPFMVMGSKAYLLSGDAGSYVEDPTLIRKVNLNANMGIVTSFEGRKTSWEIGPNFRYQIMSTYNNTYPVKEHFVNYGIHVAVGVKK